MCRDVATQVTPPTTLESSVQTDPLPVDETSSVFPLPPPTKKWLIPSSSEVMQHSVEAMKGVCMAFLGEVLAMFCSDIYLVISRQVIPVL